MKDGGTQHLVLSMDSTHKDLWNRQPFHVIDVLHSLHSIARLFATKEDGQSHECLLCSVTNFYCPLAGENPDVKFTICDNADAFFCAFKKVFPNACSIDCYFHFKVQNLPKHSKHLWCGTKINDITEGAKNCKVYIMRLLFTRVWRNLKKSIRVRSCFHKS